MWTAWRVKGGSTAVGKARYSLTQAFYRHHLCGAVGFALRFHHAVHYDKHWQVKVRYQHTTAATGILLRALTTTRTERCRTVRT